MFFFFLKRTRHSRLLVWIVFIEIPRHRVIERRMHLAPFPLSLEHCCVKTDFSDFSKPRKREASWPSLTSKNLTCRLIISTLPKLLIWAKQLNLIKNHELNHVDWQLEIGKKFRIFVQKFSWRFELFLTLRQNLFRHRWPLTDNSNYQWIRNFKSIDSLMINEWLILKTISLF